jgi:hypothetical protein
VGRVPVAGALVLVLATVVSVLLRTGDLHAGFWIDEGIAVGIAEHGFTQIPGLLLQDGSPPLYYLLLHGWLALSGDGEAAARSLSLLFAAVLVPVSWWAANAIAGRRAGVAAVAVAATCPLLSYYAQEARMYTLVALLSLIAAAAFVLAFLQGRRRHLVTLGVATALLLYTHNWGLFLVGAMAVAWVELWRHNRVAGRDGALVAAAVALAYAPWVPTLAFQVRHTGAPWSAAPSLLVLVALHRARVGRRAGRALVVGALPTGALRTCRPRDRAAAGMGRAGSGRPAPRPAAGEEQRACRRSQRRHRPSPRGRGDLHAAGTGPGPRALPAGRPRVRDAARLARGPVGHGLAKRAHAAADRAGAAHRSPAMAPDRARHARGRPLARAVGAGGPPPHARMARGPAGRSAAVPSRRDLASRRAALPQHRPRRDLQRLQTTSSLKPSGSRKNVA